MFAFDLRTIYLITSLAFFAISGGLVVTTLSTPRALKGGRTLAVSYVFSGLGYALIVVRGLVSAVIGIVVSNLLLTLSVVLLYRALCRLLSLKPDYRLSLGAIGVVLAAAVAYGLYDSQYDLRVAWMSLALGVQILQVAWTLIYRDPFRRVSSQSFTGVVFTVYGLMLLGRAVFGFAHLLPESSLLQPSPHTFTLTALTLIGNLMLPFSFLLISNESHFYKLQKLADTDTLTGLINRGVLLECLREEILKAKKLARPFSLCVVDVDQFKEVNDQFGHPAGDEVLALVAGRLQALVRQSDSAGRYGGDEFLLLLPHSTQEQAYGLADRLREHFGREPFRVGGRSHSLTLSIGVATLHEGDTMDMLLNRADQAMYKAKRTRDQVVAQPAEILN
ncbi:MAG: GGDEF domain-containing protein [Anaerolineae bacterium]|nr:MAG: GGDEF domain-containing protein [Anaerolineae bacterium]